MSHLRPDLVLGPTAARHDERDLRAPFLPKQSEAPVLDVRDPFENALEKCHVLRRPWVKFGLEVLVSYREPLPGLDQRVVLEIGGLAQIDPCAQIRNLIIGEVLPKDGSPRV